MIAHRPNTYELENRRYWLLIAFGLVFLLFIVRLFYLQVLSPDYAASAARNVKKRIIQEPTRGAIYDREGRLVVSNVPTYEILVVMNELQLPDSNLFAPFLGIGPDSLQVLIEDVQQRRGYGPTKPAILIKNITLEEYAGLQEQLYDTRGLYPQVRNRRQYQYPVGAGVLGYISEVNRNDIERSEGYYQPGDLIGTSGLERQYEQYLRGRKGVRLVIRDVHGREIGPFAEGRLDTLPEKGADINLTLDIELQAFGERLMQGKVGSIVAIQPASGEILSFVSAPGYDPSLLTGRGFSAAYDSLAHDSLSPFYTRPLMAEYPPGSIFKLMNGLTALSLGTISEQTYYGCSYGFLRNGGKPGCHGHPTPLNIRGAIIHSCNAFFAASYVDMLHSNKFENFEAAFGTWHEYMAKFGVGHRLGIDIPNERPGALPDQELYDKWYGRGRWKGMTIVSNAIGQGEILMTPLQMANVSAILANRGYYVQPHFFKAFREEPDRQIAHWDSIRLDMPDTAFSIAADAMAEVVARGTGTLAQIEGIEVAGKTGTAENPHGEDHSVFMAFAPKDNPQIAIAVIVENAGFGGTWAAPIAALMMESYLKGPIAETDWRLQRILRANFIDNGPPQRATTQYAQTDSLARPNFAPTVPDSPFNTLPTEELEPAPNEPESGGGTPEEKENDGMSRPLATLPKND